MFLLIFEFIGTQEFVLILVAALVLFGPRKLPGLARSVGKSLAEFKRASEDFKGQWEREVEREAAGLRETAKEPEPASLWDAPAAETMAEQTAPPLETPAEPAPEPVAASAPQSKQEWL
jgi:TatA/E family protein of Tat protein translocase